MVYGSETWVMTVELNNRLERTEWRMCGMLLRDTVFSEELMERIGIELMSDLVKRSRLRWYKMTRKAKEDMV